MKYWANSIIMNCSVGNSKCCSTAFKINFLSADLLRIMWTLLFWPSTRSWYCRFAENNVNYSLIAKCKVWNSLHLFQAVQHEIMERNSSELHCRTAESDLCQQVCIPVFRTLGTEGMDDMDVCLLAWTFWILGSNAGLLYSDADFAAYRLLHPGRLAIPAISNP